MASTVSTDRASASPGNSFVPQSAVWSTTSVTVTAARTTRVPASSAVAWRAANWEVRALRGRPARASPIANSVIARYGARHTHSLSLFPSTPGVINPWISMNIPTQMHPNANHTGPGLAEWAAARLAATATRRAHAAIVETTTRWKWALW